MLDAGQAAEALALIGGPAARRPDDARLTLLEAEALRTLGQPAEALQRLDEAPAVRQVVVQRLIDRSALDRPARFDVNAQPGAAKSGAALADSLADAAPTELRQLLARVVQRAHPFTVLSTAKALLARWPDPELRLAAHQAAAHAFGTMGAARSALMSLDSFAAEAGELPATLKSRLATRRGSAMLATGDRVLAAEQFSMAHALTPMDAEATGLLASLEPESDGASAEACLALLAPGRAPPRLRPWLADRAAPLLQTDDSRTELSGLPLAERPPPRPCFVTISPWRMATTRGRAPCWRRFWHETVLPVRSRKVPRRAWHGLPARPSRRSMGHW